MTRGVATGSVAATGQDFAMSVSRMALKRVLILDLMCGEIAERSHGGRWRLVQEPMVTSFRSGVVPIT